MEQNAVDLFKSESIQKISFFNTLLHNAIKEYDNCLISVLEETRAIFFKNCTEDLRRFSFYVYPGNCFDKSGNIKFASSEETFSYCDVYLRFNTLDASSYSWEDLKHGIFNDDGTMKSSEGMREHLLLFKNNYHLFQLVFDVCLELGPLAYVYGFRPHISDGEMNLFFGRQNLSLFRYPERYDDF